MSWLSLLAKPFTAVIEKVGDYKLQKQENKEHGARRTHELAEAKHSATVDRVKRQDKAETNYDLLAMQQKRDTFMDEVLILWTLAIVTLLFIPATATTALAGFTALEKAPLWFQLVFIGCYVSTLGIRFLFSGRGVLGKVVK